MKIRILYFSGTGNTRLLVQKTAERLKLLDNGIETVIQAIEEQLKSGIQSACSRPGIL